MTDVDRQIARAGELLERTRAGREALVKRRRQGTAITRRLTLVAGADLAIVVAAIAIGWFVPLGMGGALLVGAVLVAVTLFLLFATLTPAVRAEQLTQVPLKALPLMTEQWLDTQRKLLPAPAQTLVDGIGVKLETLSPQLATLDEREPVAAEVRKLIGEQLPELLKGYAKVPPPLRGVARNGKSPDAQLADALKLIDDEIGEMSAQIAQGDLDSLETRGRFLEIKYRDDGAV
ncbi:hypothetical protein [Sphingomonas echinoides]|uniref:DUF2207 domain-containing protein n=1 Tax=Sphingomonas echinoides TaxID=59803 RepID=A0ABU4PIS5_9SPHN|nr:hypothetical protein [Sphingomonas echinoides]MDX5983869.1 hypothetical protein [Sphingomonas echinoides]